MPKAAIHLEIRQIIIMVIPDASYTRLLHGLLDVTSLLSLTTFIGFPDSKSGYTPAIENT